ncbi:MAG: hypothetical protein ACI8X5_000765 [Planctomycetota bacterium]|jgi:hypothetical protein
MRGWTVNVDPGLLAAENGLGERALNLLDHKLFDVCHVVPALALKQLKQITIWMDLDDPRVQGGVYHPSREWLESNDYNPQLAKSIQFGNAENFISWSFTQPWMVMHELAHAYHHQFLGYDDERIESAYDAAKESKRYEQVLHSGGERKRAYGLNNSKEYFAELTEAYFGANDFYPFVQVEVAQFDEQAFKVLGEVWGK